MLEALIHTLLATDSHAVIVQNKRKLRWMANIPLPSTASDAYVVLEAILSYEEKFSRSPDKTALSEFLVTTEDEYIKVRRDAIGAELDAVYQHDLAELEQIKDAHVLLDTVFAETRRLFHQHCYERYKQIVWGSLDLKLPGGKGRKNYAGAEDAMEWLRGEWRKDFTEEDASQPIVLGEAAKDIMRDYRESKTEEKLDFGIDMLRFPNKSMFLGILSSAKHGKSTFSRWLSLLFALHGRAVYHVTLETIQTVERNQWGLLYSHSWVNGKDYQHISYEQYANHLLPEQDEAAIDKAMEYFAMTCRDKIIIEELGSATWPEIKAKIEDAIARWGIQVVNLDYIQLIRLESNGRNEQAAIAAVVQDIRQFIKKHNLILVSAIQAKDEGRKRAQENEFCWDEHAIHTWTELARSMELILGIWNHKEYDSEGKTRVQINHVCGRTPFTGRAVESLYMTSAGYFLTGDQYAVRVSEAYEKRTKGKKEPARPFREEPVMQDIEL